MADLLTAYIAGETGTVFDPERHECAGFALGWAALARGLDYRPLLPQDKPRLDDNAILRCAAEAARFLGVERTYAPVRGDIGFVRIGEDRRAFAVYCGDFWAGRGANGATLYRTGAPFIAWGRIWLRP